ncbi:MAG: hypothetical protein AVDCRST_MAG70-748 [uncultured Thermomicrobiales bacterium]|uniref:Ferric uptake regulation protein FUR n=1 Tax=uncultured Thermomicrobiales bacterium TaxID=1645740 RepID=A0A6J4UIA4_9BACT|nr:MAG: hypothetical protein AVDCRST_MAG70-748 [uncultured Thermomicrobiales bacterium]
MPDDPSSLGDRRSIDSAARLREAGLRVTVPRVLILEAFTPGDHLTAEEVFGRVARRAPEISRSTVYRTLETFRQSGIVSETDLGGGVRHFELLEGRRHHHLVCHRCGHQSDLDDALVEPLRGAIASHHGFLPVIDHLAIFGTCAHCQAAAAPE